MITEYNKYFYLEFQKKLDYLLKKHSFVELEIMELVKKKSQDEIFCLMLLKSLITMTLPSSVCYEFMNFR